MLKYYDYALVFAEVPDEISLAINITQCPHYCVNCHSPWLRENKGKLLTINSLMKIIKCYPDITCVCFMGGDSDHSHIAYLADFIHTNTDLKVAMYSGNKDIDNALVKVLDYYKIGGYKEEFGPLNNIQTNQRMYMINDKEELIDITNKFWEK